MSKKEYTEEDIKILLSNSNVKWCTSKYITFTDDFKVKALESDKQGIYHRKIFENFWFPNFITNSNTPGESLKKWRFRMKHKGINWLINTKKWRKTKEIFDISKMTKDEYIEFLETKLAFVEEFRKIDNGHYP